MAGSLHSSTQRRIPVLIAEARRDMLGTVLASAVMNHAGMTLLDRIPASQAGATLKDHGGRCVLLLLGQGKAHRAAAARFLTRHPDLVVIRIDMPEAGIAICLRQIGLGQLMETMCSLYLADLPGSGSGHHLGHGGCHS